MSHHDPSLVYKAAVIGAGSGGLTLAIGLAGFGHRIGGTDTPPEILAGGGVRRGPPRLGEHTAEVMAALGFGPEEIDQVLQSCHGAADAVIAAITADD